MLDTGVLSEVLRKLSSFGGEYADIFVEHRKITSIQLEDNKVEKVVSGIDSGVGLRLIHNGRTAFAFSNDLTRESLMSIAASLGRAISASSEVPALDMRKQRPSSDFLIKISPDAVPIEKKISLVKSANQTARSHDKRIRQVSVSYRDSVQKVQIADSYGNFAEDERVYTLGLVHVIAADKGIIQTGYEAEGGNIGFELFDVVSMEGLASKAAVRSVKMLSARRAPGGRMPIIISAESGGTLIHEAIGHGLEADLAQQGLSVYSNKLGQKVASALVTVIDDSTLPNKRGSFRFDDEGTPSRRTVLVEKGVLKGYMYDRLTALTNNVVSTGNGRRESYQHRPIPRMTNTFIASGESRPDEIIKSVQKGLLVKKMGGGQVNTVSGDFVFDVQDGYLIENGEVSEPVRGATLTGNGPEVLKSIDMVGSDLGFSIGTCGKDAQGVPVSDAMPTIRIPEMVVGGEVEVMQK